VVTYYGTDLGWSYRHGDRIQFLFGDTLATEKGDPISPAHDDMFGSIALAEWRDGSRIRAGQIPLLELAQVAGTARLAGIDPGVPMEGLKTPLGGFSNGTREFALFITGKPQSCRVDADCGTGHDAGLTCDAGLGFRFEPPGQQAGLTLPCLGGVPGCSAVSSSQANDTSGAASGLCVDRKSSISGSSNFGRVGSYAIRQLIALRSSTDPHLYADTREWLTNKFTNVAVRAASDRVYLWGRPGFVGLNAKGSTMGLYFAYVDMPKGPGFSWQPHYYTGGEPGTPRFSTRESDAAPLDLDASRAGVQSQEAHDIVQQMSVVWIEPLKKWVMFYGGGVSTFPIPGFAPNCGVLEIFARTECKDVAVGNGAVRMRTADQPWGPWTPPQDVIIGGDAAHRPLEHQYAPGGVLHHPACSGSACVGASAHQRKGDYGWLYGANIIEEWTRPAGQGVEVIWNASTWNPYRVVLLKTRIEP
jgi:hypothetical protein